MQLLPYKNIYGQTKNKRVILISRSVLIVHLCRKDRDGSRGICDQLIFFAIGLSEIYEDVEL